ncbi:hypothetical protein [Asticcacaulis tiandongensis]|uniref:hypothetical protein n=1 Tax=Asticcacaulis tiandongensis TaxID=2565365 RepID=UPI00112B184B|nr:hypothetical protein [Asticcacaulis tiandongensis]
MRRIHITPSENEYLSNVDFPFTEYFRPDASSAYFVTLSDEMVENCNDAFTKQLAASGFDANYNLNDEGRLLEGLIDKFATHLL